MDQGNVGNARTALFEQGARATDAVAVQIRDGRDAHFLVEAARQIALVDREMLRQSSAVDRLGEVLVQVGHDRTGQPLALAAEPFAARERLFDLRQDLSRR